MMQDTQAAFIAGFMTGRGSFGVNDEYWPWLYFRSLDPEITSRALERWGREITTNREKGSPVSYKWTTGGAALRALEALALYLVAYKRSRAEEMLARTAACDATARATRCGSTLSCV